MMMIVMLHTVQAMFLFIAEPLTAVSCHEECCVCQVEELSDVQNLCAFEQRELGLNLFFLNEY